MFKVSSNYSIIEWLETPTAHEFKTNAQWLCHLSKARYLDESLNLFRRHELACMNFVIQRLRQFLLFLSIAFSFGGFTFYATIVIPAGTEVLDATTQGFVTEKVTYILNIANAFTLACLIWEWSTITQPKLKLLFFILTILYCICGITLLVLHPSLGQWLDRNDLSVVNRDAFYSVHRIYLWVSTIQWANMLGLIWLVTSRYQTADGGDATPAKLQA